MERKNLGEEEIKTVHVLLAILLDQNNIVNNLGEPWISFYSRIEIEKLLSKNNFKLKEVKKLIDLNDKYFTTVNRKIEEKNIFNLENFVVAQNF